MSAGFGELRYTPGKPAFDYGKLSLTSSKAFPGASTNFNWNALSDTYGKGSQLWNVSNANRITIPVAGLWRLDLSMYADWSSAGNVALIGDTTNPGKINWAFNGRASGFGGRHSQGYVANFTAGQTIDWRWESTASGTVYSSALGPEGYYRTELYVTRLA